MILHYLTTALANFRKTPFTTATNVLTLALGLACFIAAFGIATYWKSADAYHEGAERVFFLGQSVTPRGDPWDGTIGPHTSAKFARPLLAQVPEAEVVVRAAATPPVAVVSGDARALLNIGDVDPEFLDLFEFEFVAGNPMSARADPRGVILTENAAQRLFGAEPALGRQVIMDGHWEGHVSGVIAAPRQPSFMGDHPDAVFQFDALRNFGASPLGPMTDNARFTPQIDLWATPTTLVFVRLRQGADAEAVNGRLPEFIERTLPQDLRTAADVKLELAPLDKLATLELDNRLFGRSGVSLSIIAVLAVLGALTLGVACANYANLTTAQMLSRTREISLRKVLGAGRAQITIQIWLEAALQTLAGSLVALGVLIVAAPMVQTSTSVDVLHLVKGGFGVWIGLIALAVLVTSIAAAYPALVSTGVRPARRLRGLPAGSGATARILLGMQFASASFLLIVTIVVQLQNAELERAGMNRQTDQVVVLNDLFWIETDYATLRERLLREPGIQAVSVVDRPPWSRTANVAKFSRSADPGANGPVAYSKTVGFDYFRTLGLDLIAGRTFDPDRDSSTEAQLGFSADAVVVIDAAYADRLGFASPQAAIGETLYMPSTFSASGAYTVTGRIIGVVASEVTRLGASDVPGQSVAGHVYSVSPRPIFGGTHPLVRISAENTRAGILSLERVWRSVAPDVPPNFHFLDDLFEQAYRQYARVGQVFILLAGVTFVIASTGLLGIAVHVAARRRHEIAVRKTLGSTTWGAVRLLLADFSKPVIVANLIAWPLGYLAAETYLSAFAHRIDLTVWPFALSMLITLAIAWLAVGGQTYRAASVRPAQVLRDA